MKKIDLAARALQQVFPKLTQDSKIGLQEMMHCVGNARDQVIKQNAFAMWGADQELVWDGMLSEFNGEKLIKESDCLYYLELPAKPLYLPKGMGIYEVVFSEDTSNPLIPVKSTFRSLFRNSLARQLSGYKGYYQKGDRIYIVGTGVTEGTEINLTMVVQSEDIDPYDYFPFPADMENDIIKLAVEQFVITAQIPEDRRDDNRDEAM